MPTKTLLLAALLVIGQSLNLFADDPIAPISPAEGDGSSEEPYEIETLNQLYWIALETRNGESFENVYFLQTSDIDADDTAGWFDDKGWLPMGLWSDNPFSGNYDGGGHTISNLHMHRPNEDAVSLFGYVDNATIHDLHLVNAHIVGDGNVGGITGRAKDSGITYCTVSGEIRGINFVGGIAGRMINVTIDASYNKADITALLSYAGGIVGRMNDGTINESYNYGDIQGSHSVGGIAGLMFDGIIEKSYNKADIKANQSAAGGIVGRLSLGAVNNCYNLGNITGSSFIAGLVGSGGALPDKSGVVEIYNSFSAGKITESPAAGKDMSLSSIPDNINVSDKPVFEKGRSNKGPHIGGVIGYLDNDASVTISHCFFDKDEANLGESTWDDQEINGIKGKTTAEMMDPETYAAWGITEDEDVVKGYPFLAWQDIGSKDPVWKIGTGSAAVPLSNTTLYLSLALIAGFVFFRIYRIS